MVFDMVNIRSYNVAVEVEIWNGNVKVRINFMVGPNFDQVMKNIKNILLVLTLFYAILCTSSEYLKFKETGLLINGDEEIIKCVSDGNFGEKCSTRFYMCVWVGINFHIHWLECATPTVFDPNISSCNWPEDISCPTASTTPPFRNESVPFPSTEQRPTTTTAYRTSQTSENDSGEVSTPSPDPSSSTQAESTTTLESGPETRQPTTDYDYESTERKSTTDSVSVYTTINPWTDATTTVRESEPSTSVSVSTTSAFLSTLKSTTGFDIVSTTPEAQPHPTTIQMDCPVKCLSDKFDVKWIACPGETKMAICPRKTEGEMSWKCLENGSFEGRLPDISGCVTRWVENMTETIAKERTITWESARSLLSLTRHNVERARKFPNSSYQYFGHEIMNVLRFGQAVLAKIDIRTVEKYEFLTDITIDIYEDVLLNDDAWLQLSQVGCSKSGTYFLEKINKNLLILSTTFTKEDTNNRIKKSQYLKSFNFPTFFTSVGVIQSSLQQPGQKLVFPADSNSETESYIELPPDWAKYVNDVAEFVGTKLDSTHANNLFPAFLNLNNSDRNDSDNSFVNGPLLAFTFGANALEATNMTFDNYGVRITFEHSAPAWGSEVYSIPRKLGQNERPKAVKESAICVYWNTEDMLWDSEGCRLIEVGRFRTICECFHLTSFAVIMSLHKYQGKDLGLEILTWLLCSVSIVCLGLAIATFSIVKSIKSHRITLTRHVCFCLMIGMILMLTLMDRNVILTGDELCQVFGALVHYIFLASFIWMLFEGILLYRMVIIVFETGKDYMNHQRLIAYGLPLLIVGITFISGLINKHPAYGGDAFCWLEDNYKWAFLGPVLIVVILNSLILFKSLRIAYSVQQNHPSKATTQKIQTFIQWTRGSFSTGVLLGITWTFGYFMLIPNVTTARISSYLFTVFNASQGIFLFGFHCIANKHIRDIYGSKLSSIYNSNSSSTQDLTQSVSEQSYTGGSITGQNANQTRKGRPARKLL